MDEIKRRNIINIVVVVLVVVIFTVYRFTSSTDNTTVIGVDDEKIGITLEDGSAQFIMLSDIEGIDYLESLDYVTVEYTMIGDESQGAYILIETKDENYVVNASTKAATWQSYKDIVEKWTD